MKTIAVLLIALLMVVAGMTVSAEAFSTVGAKWGSPVFGTPGSASFSVMPAGSTMEPGEGLATAFSALFAGNELAFVHTAFAVWAAVTNLTDLGTVSDSGAAFNAAPADPRGTGGPFGDIRLAASDIPDAGVLAHAYYPPPNGTSAAGDMHFDDTYLWADDPYDTTADGDFDFFTVALHELGHSLGLGHSSDTGSVMYAYYSGARRTLNADDISGIQYIYGAMEAVPEPGTLLLLGSGLAGLAAWARRRSARRA